MQYFNYITFYGNNHRYLVIFAFFEQKIVKVNDQLFLIEETDLNSNIQSNECALTTCKYPNI